MIFDSGGDPFLLQCRPRNAYLRSVKHTHAIINEHRDDNHGMRS